MPDRKSSYPTIRDVAAQAGTSTATVSYVLNGATDRPISEELRQRVLQAADELHYSKSAVASGLRANRRGMIFILIPQFSNIFFTRVCEKIEDYAFSHDILPMICDTREDPDREKHLIERAVSQRVDGVILGPTSRGFENTQLLRDRGIPYVAIGREILFPNEVPPEERGYFVGDDSFQAGYEAGRCFVRNGHKHFGVIRWKSDVTSVLGRNDGFFEAISEAVHDGGSVTDISSEKLSVEEGYRLTAKMMKDAHPTALFFSYHRYAQGGVQYLLENGYRIPEDVSVILVGTPAWAKLSTPVYHMIYQNEELVGSMAGSILMSVINNEKNALVTERRHIVVCALQGGASVRKLER